MAKAAFIAAPNQRTAYINANVLDGTEGMEPLEGYAVVVEGQRIVEVAPTAEADLAGCELVDLKGAYLLPGLINMHVHLAGNGKPQKKQRDNEALVKKVMANGLTRAIAYRLVAEYARLELHSGVTTIRTVGGLGDFDTRVRDAGAAGKLDAPRILAANQGISVPGGHMAGSVAIAAHSISEALEQVDVARAQGADLIKLMITGGVLDAKEKGTPGELKMDPAMVRAVCDRAHELGFAVAAHVESTEGVRVALEGGVDSIEHGAAPTDDIMGLFKKNGPFLCTTISPALPYALFDRSVSCASEVEQYNGNMVFEGIIANSKAALEQGVPVALGNDVGCPWITQYDFWRELRYFEKYVGVSRSFALHTATLRNARLAGIGDVTGSIEVGKDADMIVVDANPLDDLRALRTPKHVIHRGRFIAKPNVKRNAVVDRELDKFL
ncbi:MAG: peptidase [Coriobacteriia bacterium]|nr:MAG: peptidase [Coriobacteriia bacterium]